MGPRMMALPCPDVAAQVVIESKICERFIILWLQALKPSTVNDGTSWGQPALPCPANPNDTTPTPS
jgi:hypothetical protein